MKSVREFDADVIVVGGGPGGAAAATMLARKGWRVRLYERDHFPREHVGESLLPASMPVLAEMGVLPAVEAAGFLPKYGATMVWGSDPNPWSWSFRESSPRYPHAYQVVRAEFDHLLLRNAAAHGADVREGHRVLEATTGAAGASLRVLDDCGQERPVSARFVVDASGQAGLIGRARGLREADPFFRNLAVYGYYESGVRLPGAEANNIFIESTAAGWVWTIPLHTGQTSVGVVVDSDAGRDRIQAIGLDRFFGDQVSQAPRTSALLAGARLSAGPTVVRDWSYASREVAGEGFVLVGDAACFIDPLFSSGVHLALSSGVLAAAYVTSALKDAELGWAAASVYAEIYDQQYGHFRELARLFYASNRTVDSYFWEARRITAGDDATPARLAFIRAVAGQPPVGYERAVLAHGETPRSFAEAVGGIEAERSERAAAFEARFGAATPAARFLAAAPRLAADAALERKPVADEGEFVWGEVLRTATRSEGMPVSDLVARVIALVAAGLNVGSILEGVGEHLGEERAAHLQPQIAEALRLLYLDGAIEEFVEAGAS